MEVFAIHVMMFLPTIFLAHFIGLFIDDNSKHQKKKFRKSLDLILSNLDFAKQAGIRYPTVDFIYRKRNFRVGVYKKEHNYRYTTYEIFINDDEAGIYHQIGDCCTSEYYFEKQNRREKFEVIEIVNACAKQIKKEMKKRSKQVADTLTNCDNYSYFK